MTWPTPSVASTSCLNHAVEGPKFGRELPRWSPPLNGAQALAFVLQLQRAEEMKISKGTPAAGVSLRNVYKMKSHGVIGNIGKGGGCSTTQKYFVFDSGCDFLSFAGSSVETLANGKLTFHTVAGEDLRCDHNQDVNSNRSALYQGHRAARFRAAEEGYSCADHDGAQATFDVMNGGAPAGLAAPDRRCARQEGLSEGQCCNTTSQAPRWCLLHRSRHGRQRACPRRFVAKARRSGFPQDRVISTSAGATLAHGLSVHLYRTDCDPDHSDQHRGKGGRRIPCVD